MSDALKRQGGTQSSAPDQTASLEVTGAQPATLEIAAAPPNRSASRAAAAEARRIAELALRRRMKIQALVMLAVAVLMLVTALSVPFVLRYLQIAIP